MDGANTGNPTDWAVRVIAGTSELGQSKPPPASAEAGGGSLPDGKEPAAIWACERAFQRTR